MEVIYDDSVSLEVVVFVALSFGFVFCGMCYEEFVLIIV